MMMMMMMMMTTMSPASAGRLVVLLFIWSPMHSCVGFGWLSHELHFKATGNTSAFMMSHRTLKTLVKGITSSLIFGCHFKGDFTLSYLWVEFPSGISVVMFNVRLSQRINAVWRYLSLTVAYIEPCLWYISADDWLIWISQELDSWMRIFHA